jgi:FkbM family methyltransferase
MMHNRWYWLIKGLFFSEAAKGNRWKVLGKFVLAHVRFFFHKSFITNWVRGIRLYVIQHRASSTSCYYFGKYDWSEMCFLEKYLRNTDVFADIGSNIGSYALFAASCGARVIAVEPCPSALRILKKNIMLNPSLKDRISCKGTAVGETDGEVYFTTGNDTTNRIVKNAQDGKGEDAVKVQCRRLDSIIRQCSVIKMDVENYEIPALKGSRKLLENEKCNAVIIEAFEEAAQIKEILGSHGFYPYTYDVERNRLAKHNGPQKGNNLIFIKDIRKARKRLKGERI